MNRQKCGVNCVKIWKFILYPIARTRKMIRKAKMSQLKIAAGLLFGISCFVTFLIYWNRSPLPDHKFGVAGVEPSIPVRFRVSENPMRHIHLDEIYLDQSKHYPNESYEFNDNKPVHILDTPGCKIPISIIDYDSLLSKDKKPNVTCGKRAVFLKKVGRDTVQALIKPKIMKKYLRKSAIFDCCYRFIKSPVQPRYDNRKIKFTRCVKFKDSAIITLETDFISVKCFDYDKRNMSHTIYEDSYVFAKSILNVTSSNDENCRMKYNVLMIGIDSMSLPRFVKSLKRTAKYFKDNYWLGYRGYHKVGDNTLPNLMAVLTGKNETTIADECSGKMHRCHHLFIWNQFKKSGYVTAYGEDYLRLPDTFSNKYAFNIPPTDHYMRPFFLKGETELNNKSLVCAGKISSGQQLLNYALDFANTYRSDQFFGLFWLNSFSHNINSRPQDADSILENFFNQLGYTGIYKNTFVFVFSDHGIRFGDNLFKIESYYDDRMPSLFIFTPEKFKGRHSKKLTPMLINQFRLTTPYDLYNTLLDINKISRCENSTGNVLEACPNCHSLFETISANRTCQDVAIHDKWCSCHKMYALPNQDIEGEKSVQTAVSHVKSLIKSVQTRRCWECRSLSMKNIIRIHFYFTNDKKSLYYVVAFAMTPGNAAYEAVVHLKNGTRTLVGPISVISPYRGQGNCTIKRKDRLFCLCQKQENC